jgi:hypothetical protein
MGIDITKATDLQKYVAKSGIDNCFNWYTKAVRLSGSKLKLYWVSLLKDVGVQCYET